MVMDSYLQFLTVYFKLGQFYLQIFSRKTVEYKVENTVYLKDIGI